MPTKPMPRNLSMKVLWVQFRSLRLFVHTAMAGMAAVAVASLIFAGVFVANARHETARTCDAIERVTQYLFVQGPSTRERPDRTPEQQAAYERYRSDTLAGIAAACGD